MNFTEFQEAQTKLSAYLQKHLHGEVQNGQLEKRAQKLADTWWRNQRKPVLLGNTGIMVVGCTLGFDIGTIKVRNWLTRFTRDRFDLHRKLSKVIALGYVNESQLYITEVEGVPHLCARDTPLNVERWAAHCGLIPNPITQPDLFVALERAKALGYLDYLKGQK